MNMIKQYIADSYEYVADSKIMRLIDAVFDGAEISKLDAIESDANQAIERFNLYVETGTHLEFTGWAESA